MGLFKDIKHIKETLDKINSGSLVAKAAKCEELEGYLDNVTFNVDKVRHCYDETGLCSVEVTYSITPIKIYIDEDGTVIPNERFKSINMLNLISLEDMYKIREAIEIAQRKNKGE